MVVRFEHFWPMYVLLLIPMAFSLMLMGLISIWMVSMPLRERVPPEYSLHVMYEQPKTGKGGGSGTYAGSPYGFTKAAAISTAYPSKQDYSKSSGLDMQDSAFSRSYHQDPSGYSNPAFDRSTASAGAYSEKSRVI